MKARISRITDIVIDLDDEDIKRVLGGMKIYCDGRNADNERRLVTLSLAKEIRHESYPPKVSYEEVRAYKVFIDRNSLESLPKTASIEARQEHLGSKIEFWYHPKLPSIR